MSNIYIYKYWFNYFLYKNRIPKNKKFKFFIIKYTNFCKLSYIFIYIHLENMYKIGNKKKNPSDYRVSHDGRF